MFWRNSLKQHHHLRNHLRDRKQMNMRMVKTTKSIWFPSATPKYSFISWFATRNRLATGDRTQHWNPQQTPQCVLCTHSLETRDHLFFTCPYSAEIWESLSRGIMQSHYTSVWSEVLAYLQDSTLDYVPLFTLKYVFQAVLYGVWRERNLRKHGEKPSPPSRLIKLIDKAVRNRLSSAREAGNRKLNEGLVFWFSIPT